MTDVTDILGSEGASGSPDAIRRVATQLDDISTAASSIKSNLSALDAAHWTGAAANLYRQKQDTEIPGELSKIASSFGIASGALAAYANGLESVISQAQALAGNYSAEYDGLASATRAEASAAQNLRDARQIQASATDPVARAQAASLVSDAARSFSGAAANKQAVEDRIGQLDQQAGYLRALLSQDAYACATQLQDASAAGITNSLFSWADRNIVDGVPGAFVSGAVADATNFVAATARLGEAELTLALDPVDRQRWDHVAAAYSDWVDAARPIIEAVAICALVAAAVVIVFFQPETIVAVMPALSAIGEATTEVGIALDATKTVSDGYLCLRGERSGAIVAHDAVNTGLDAALSKLDPGTDNQVSDLSSSLDTYKATGTSQAKGWITKRVAALHGAELHSVVVNVSGTVVQTVIDSQFPFMERDVNVLLAPPAASAPPAMAGPFTSITQGPTSRVRAILSPRPVSVPVFP